MTGLSPELGDLAAECGVATEYWDWRGNHVVQPAGTIVAVLRALGIDAATSQAAAAALEARRRDRWTRLLPPCVVTGRAGRAGSTCMSATARPCRSGSSWRPAV